jgi:hypothetical protein
MIGLPLSLSSIPPLSPFFCHRRVGPVGQTSAPQRREGQEVLPTAPSSGAGTPWQASSAAVQELHVLPASPLGPPPLPLPTLRRPVAPPPPSVDLRPFLVAQQSRAEIEAAATSVESRRRRPNSVSARFQARRRSAAAARRG